MNNERIRTGSTDQLDYEAAVVNIQREAAEQAANVGQFQSNYHQYAEDVLEGRTTVSFDIESNFTIDTSAVHLDTDPTATTIDMMTDQQATKLRAAIHSHQTEIIDNAANGIGNLGVEEMPDGQLGEAQIGGDGRVSKGMLANMQNAADAKQANHAGKHEQGHMDSVVLSGELIVDGEQKKVVTLYESFAELEGNEGVGEGAHYFRPGQPDDYRHAQEVGIVLQDTVGKEYEATMTQSGDVDALQQALDKQGRGRTEDQIREEVQAEVQAA